MGYSRGPVPDAKPGYCTKNTPYADGDSFFVTFGMGFDASNTTTLCTDNNCQTPASIGPVNRPSGGGICIQPTA